MKTISLATKIHAVPAIRPLLDDYCISETPGRACQWNVRGRYAAQRSSLFLSHSLSAPRPPAQARRFYGGLANRALAPKNAISPKDLMGLGGGLSCKRLSLNLLVSAMYIKGY